MSSARAPRIAESVPGVDAFAFLQALDAIESRIVLQLKLETAPAFGNLAEITGSWKGEEVRLRACAWEGPRVGLFRTVRILSEQLEVVSVLGWARAPLAAPILSADLVATSANAALIVADLSPLDPSGSTDQELPGWARQVFSNSPVFERVTPESAPVAVQRVLDLTDQFVRGVQSARAASNPQARDAAVDRYRDAHLADERMQTMLTRIFGPATAQRLMQAVLFPRESTLDVHA